MSDIFPEQSIRMYEVPNFRGVRIVHEFRELVVGLNQWKWNLTIIIIIGQALLLISRKKKWVPSDLTRIMIYNTQCLPFSSIYHKYIFHLISS